MRPRVSFVLLFCGLLSLVAGKPHQSTEEINADIRRMRENLAHAETATRNAKRMYSSLSSVFSAFDRRFGHHSAAPAHSYLRHTATPSAGAPMLLEEGEAVRVGARSAVQSRLRQAQSAQQRVLMQAAAEMQAEEPVLLADPLPEAEINQIVHGSPVGSFVDRLEHQYYHDTAQDRAAMISLKSDTNHLLNHIDFHTRRLRDHYLTDDAILLEMDSTAADTASSFSSTADVDTNAAALADYDEDYEELALAEDVQGGDDGDTLARIQDQQDAVALAAELDAIDEQAGSSLLQEGEKLSTYTLHTDAMPAARASSALELDSLLQDDEDEDEDDDVEKLMQGGDTMASFIAIDEQVNGKREDTASLISDAEIMRMATTLPYSPPDDALVHLKHAVQQQQEVENSQIQLEEKRIERLLGETNERMVHLHDRVLRNLY